MKKIERSRTYPLILIGVLIIATVSCEKEELLQDPVLSWSNPADITTDAFTLDATLSVTQMNAAADVPGTFVYTPEIGTKLKVGNNQVLSVTFIPTDKANFKIVKDTVKINVKAPSIGTVTDIDGNVYNTVIIGTQIWMVENLRTTKFNDGSAIIHLTDLEWTHTTGAYCWYNNDSTSNKNSYGALYNWLVVDSASNGGKNVCPAGWHVPSENEWNELITFLGGESIAGGKMKETGISRWGDPNTGANNESGFAAIPGGELTYDYVNDTKYYFSYMQLYSYWWSSSPDNDNHAKCLILDYDSSGAQTFYENIPHGTSIRCIKD